MRGFRQHLAQVSASGDLERGLDGDLHFDTNLNRHSKITGRAYGLKMVADLRGIAELEQESSTSPTLTTMVAKQPVLPEYPGTKFSSESFTRRFQPDWYKKYPWLSYDVE